MPADDEWAEVTSPSWEPKFERKEDDLGIRFTGPCPRCDHETSTEVPKLIPGTPTLRGKVEEFTMFCSCGHPHLNHPEDDNSCGAYWLFEAEL
jgi:hypothetical protein